MPSAEPAEPKQKEYDGEISESLRAAAADLDKLRAENKIPQAEPEPDRTYRWTSGSKEGERVPDNYTLDAERAARELTAVRQAEQAAKPENARFIDPQQQQPLQNAVDNLRAHFPNKELPPDIIQQIEQNYQQQQAQQQQPVEQAQAQPEPQPQPEPQDAQQAERQRLEVAWKNTPVEIQNAIQQEISSTEAARQAYQQATWQAAQVSHAALFSSFPELTGLSGDQLNGAIAVN